MIPITFGVTERYSVEDNDSSLKLIFPYEREWWLIVPLSLILLYLLLWNAGNLVSAILQTPAPPIALSENEQAAVSALWVFYIGFVVMGLIELLWQLAGKEVVQINDEGMTIRHTIWGIGLTRSFRAKKMQQGVFVSKSRINWFTQPQRLRYWDFKRGKIAFNYGKTLWGVVTFRFGMSVNREEAQCIVAMIHKKFPQYKYTRPAKA